MKLSVILLCLLISMGLLTVEPQLCKVKYNIWKNKRIPSSIIPKSKQKARDRSECIRLLHKDHYVQSATFSHEDGCLLYAQSLLPHELENEKGSYYILNDCDSCFCWQKSVIKRKYGSFVINVGGETHKVFCDMVTEGGGWTVFQRRVNANENFTRSWEEYARGFGNLGENFWLGNRLIHKMSSSMPQMLYIHMVSFEGNSLVAKYGEFSVGPEQNNFVLRVDNYSGNAGDSLNGGPKASLIHNGMAFTTYDVDNDKSDDFNCAVERRGGWWYNDCLWSNLNGLYLNKLTNQAVVWNTWKQNMGLMRSSMRMKPVVA